MPSSKNANATKLRPLDDRVVVKRLEAEEKTTGGIILPDSAKEKPQKGEVVAVGAGKLLDNGNRATPDVKAGDVILFGKWSGTEVKVDGEELLIMREGDILAKF
jgi:chaperonin GroES